VAWNVFAETKPRRKETDSTPRIVCRIEAERDFSERHEVVPLAFMGIYTAKNSEAGDRIGNDRKVLTVGTDERDCFLNGRHPHIVEDDVRAWVAKQRC
jgi:hypothetical protein